MYVYNRLLGSQRPYYQDLHDSELPSVTVIIPMHNEEKVAADILNATLRFSYPAHLLEIMPVNDHSTDRTAEIIDDFHRRHPRLIHPLHRHSGNRGKPAALNEALQIARGEIVVIFDADYLPGRGLLRDLVTGFKDPQVGAVMGRVVPVNLHRSLLPRLIDIERSGGYQIDQQARYNLGLMVQYGGTVGGFRRELVISLGGFSTEILAEDTELTAKLYLHGWKVAYGNRLECYEEAPEDWEVRKRQIKRWARGHTQVMCKYLLPLLQSPHLNIWQKLDTGLFLCYYLTALLVSGNLAVSLLLFYLGAMDEFAVTMFIAYGVWQFMGNVALFYEMGLAVVIDGGRQRLLLIPLLILNYFIYSSVMTAAASFLA
ncbi:MAG: glycosyltransferase [Desulfurispora sp.]|uniref:glycosyltransferase n=1 Tax=Desulfurispora sp. TaxID=3014275 RepID=UPI00404A7BEF